MSFPRQLQSYRVVRWTGLGLLVLTQLLVMLAPRAYRPQWLVFSLALASVCAIVVASTALRHDD